MATREISNIGDILYRVDPKQLSVRVFKIGKPDEVYNYTTTTYENFTIECEKKRFQVPCDKFPFEYKGIWYFLSEDDANSFVKAQIGL